MHGPTGHFTQEDPIGLAGGLNLYGFAGGDPVNFSDPFGLCFWDVCAVESVAALAIVGGATALMAKYNTAHPEQARAVADALSGALVSAGERWEGFKRQVGTTIRVGLVVIGAAASQGRVARDVQKAKVEAEQRKKEQEKEIRRKKKDENGGGDGSPPPEGGGPQAEELRS